MISELKLYIFLGFLALLAGCAVTATISIKVAKSRGEQIDKLEYQLEELQQKSLTYDQVLYEFIEQKQLLRSNYDYLQTELEAVPDDCVLPDSFEQLWEDFTAAQSCRPSGATEALSAASDR